MSSKNKYIPPHLRRSSQNQPPPSSFNDRFRGINYNQNNVNRWSQNTYGHRKPYTSNRRYNHNQNNHSLEEKEILNDEIETISLDDTITEMETNKQKTIELLSQFTNDISTAKLIYDICYGDLLILIPNTFDRDEFLKYWFVMGKGPMINEYRDYQRVELYPAADYLKLIRRGGIATIKGYKPTKTAKLRLECRFIYRHPKEGIRFAFRSNGVRDPESRLGYAYEEGSHIWINSQYGANANAIYIRAKDGDFVVQKKIETSIQPTNKELTVIFIDDGEKMQIQYIDDKKMNYYAEYPSTGISNAAGLYRIALYNRREQRRATDLTYLQLSIVTVNDENIEY